MSVGDDSWEHDVCWTKSGIVLAFGKLGFRNLMDIDGASISVGYIWSRLRSGETDHCAGVGSAAAGRNN